MPEETKSAESSAGVETNTGKIDVPEDSPKKPDEISDETNASAEPSDIGKQTRAQDNVYENLDIHEPSANPLGGPPKKESKYEPREELQEALGDESKGKSIEEPKEESKEREDSEGDSEEESEELKEELTKESTEDLTEKPKDEPTVPEVEEL